ncbi:hypothetical protein V2J09_008661 [Rumex salicifolius]
MATRLNLTRRTLMIARSIPTGVTATNGSHRVFVAIATRPLQKKEKQEEEVCEKALEAAESLKEGANQVKETCQFVRETAEATSNTVSKATREVTDRITAVTDAVKEKMKEPMDGILTDVWGKATKRFEDNMGVKDKAKKD